MVKAGIAFILVLLVVGGSYYYWGYQPEILKRATQRALDDFSQSMQSKDRGKAGGVLKNLLTDNAKIRLEVSIVSLSQMQGGPPEIEDFDKPTFATFIDNTLYSLQDYGMSSQVREFCLDLDKKGAAVTFTSREWGDSESSYGESHINSRFVADTVCEGHVVFDNKQVMFDSADCKIKLRDMPKIGQEKKIMQSPEALKQLLR